MIKKLVSAAISVVLMAALLGGCREYDPMEDICDTLGVDVSQGTVLNMQDSHGGFHGDGLMAVTISFTQEQADALIPQFEDLSPWQPYPLTENLTTALYGSDVRGPAIQDYETHTPLIPEISNGWYYFYDRHSDSEDPLDDSPLFSRYSYNFTVAVFDVDTRILYYFELDT